MAGEGSLAGNGEMSGRCWLQGTMVQAGKGGLGIEAWVGKQGQAGKACLSGE